MKKERKRSEPGEKKGRILFFDLLRILCVSIIVYAHLQFGLIPSFNAFFFADGYLPLNLYSTGLQGWAVYGLILISGAVLEYNYKYLEGSWNYSKFLFRRFIRLYPAFWMSLLFGLVLDILLTSSYAQEILKSNLFFILFEYTGFFVILGKGPGFINLMGWFIAAIICLYILFPFLSQFVRKYRLLAIIGLMLVSFGSRALFFSYSTILPDAFWMWFPLCNLFEFSLGVYLIQTGLYPKNEKEYPIIHEVAELSFYVFLFHVIIIQVFHTPMGFSNAFSGFIEQQFLQYPSIGYALWYLTIEVVIILVSIAAMIADRRIQIYIRQNAHVKTYLKP